MYGERVLGRLEHNLAKLSDVVVDRSDLLLNVCASTGLLFKCKLQEVGVRSSRALILLGADVQM